MSLYSMYSSFLVINVCNQGKTLCSPCSKVECSVSFLHGNVILAVPLTGRHWHSESCDIKGFTGCIMLGAAAFRYST